MPRHHKTFLRKHTRVISLSGAFVLFTTCLVKEEVRADKAIDQVVQKQGVGTNGRTGLPPSGYPCKGPSNLVLICPQIDPRPPTDSDHN